MAEALEGDDAARKRELVVTTARDAPRAGDQQELRRPAGLVDFDGSY